jgi:hypothetical protein
MLFLYQFRPSVYAKFATATAAAWTALVPRNLIFSKPDFDYISYPHRAFLLQVFKVLEAVRRVITLLLYIV